MAVLTTTEDLALRSTIAASAYDILVYNIFPPPRPGATPSSVVVAFTSVNPGEGVTHVVSALLRTMRGSSPDTAFNVDMDWLRRQPVVSGTIGTSDAAGSPAWSSGWEHRKRLVQQLRKRSRYVVIDCPALSASGDCMSLAPLVDGVVMVVEADRTKKSQIRNAESRIEAAGGKILGLVLNKRQYPVPNSIYKLV